MAEKKKQGSSERERIDTGRDERYVMRDEKGRFEEVEDVGRSQAQDRKRKAKNESEPGRGDKGDR
jgi:hypothetical protein